jgi:hypothetical protein
MLVAEYVLPVTGGQWNFFGAITGEDLAVATGAIALGGIADKLHFVADPRIMNIDTNQAVEHLALALDKRSIASSRSIAEKCIWLEACGYPGLKVLAEALTDDVRELVLVRDSLGLDLKAVSCVFLGDKIADYVARHGRIFLRNVRHGLFLLPDSVENNYGIGCPVDPSFALGGERTKDPYAEKLEIAARDGIDVDEEVWGAVTSDAK